MNQNEVPENYTIFWSDELNDLTIYPSNWKFETGDGTDYGLPIGWCNNVLYNYANTLENSGIVANEENSSCNMESSECQQWIC